MTTRRLWRFRARRPLAMLAALAAGLAAYAGTGVADPAAAAARPAAAQTAGAQTAAAQTAAAQTTAAQTAGAQTAGAQTAGAPAGVCSSAAHPRMAAEVSRGIARALAGRSSIAGITAYDPVTGIRCEYHQWWQFPSASVVKVVILGTLLHELQVRHEHLTTRQVTLTTAMITQSDNDAATALWDEVGMARLRYFLAIAKMDHTVLGQDGYWGLTAVNAHDEMLLLRLLVTRNSVLDGASRAYALSLMARVIRSQRWGVTAGTRPDVRVHVKNGWLPVPTLWVVNSIGDFTHRHGGPYSIAILTSHNPDMAYGIETIQAVASQINRVMGAPVR